jgi:hypothetical protein
MTTTIVDALYGDFQDLIQNLDKSADLSLRNTAEDTFRKALLLASASYFEDKIISDLINYFNESSSSNQLATEFLKNKAISRQYHTFFKWEEKNANNFFGLFGESFKNFMKEEVRTNMDLAESIKVFLELGNDRNRLIHGNYGNFSLEKTAEEIFQSYKTAYLFVEIFPKKLREFQNSD